MAFLGRTDVKEDLVVIRDLMKIIARIEPEGADAEVDVIFLPFAPEVFGRFRVGRVVLVFGPMKSTASFFPPMEPVNRPCAFM